MADTECWIGVVKEEEANADLSKIYDRVRGPGGQLDNLYKGFSLRPHTIIPADDLYLAAMHHEKNTLPKRISELLGTYVAILSNCKYALAHHGHNFIHLTGDKERAENVIESLYKDELGSCGDRREVAALHYAKRLCLQPDSVQKADVEALKSSGWADGEVLEIVQVVAMFSYFVRVINGVGISLGDEKTGLY